MILFSDLYSPSNLVVATFQNSNVLLHFSVWEDTQSDRLIAFDALRVAIVMCECPEEATVILISACLLQILGTDSVNERET